ncbi:MAG: hypothetical protein WAO02_02580 [Verrucomicrobiia bacterium]
MPSIGDNLYDNYKDRRYGALFVSVLFAFFGLLILGAVICGLLYEVGSEEYFGEALLGIGILGLTWGFLKFRQARARSREKLRRGPLSRDEMRVARSKLRNGMKTIHRPAPRVPDTNLKY